MEDGLKIGEDLGKVVYEFYLLDNKGNLKRVNEKDYNNKKEIYDKQQQEKQDKIGEAIAEKYGITDQMSNKSTNYYER